MRFSAFSIFREALRGNRGWTPQWREPDPKPHYDVIIVGGGGHGLSTAYYLAKEFGITNVAVLEKSWLGSGNIGRNTTIIRSNYLLPGNEPFYEFSMKLWEGLEQDFNYNAMVSQRGVLNLCHTDGQRDAFARRANGMLLEGAGAQLLDREGVRRMAVITPGFSADCLETLEEIAIRAGETFRENGGTHFAALPCLNDSDEGMRVIEHVVRRELMGWV